MVRDYIFTLVMADIKSLQELTKDAALRDAPFIDTIKTDLRTAIDATTINEAEYKVIYDIDTTLTTAQPLQKTRITNTIIKTLTDLGYKAFINDDAKLQITWVIATLSVAPL